ncbi:MAG: 3-isopropylmalate dehydratase small subunit [Gemmatimonadetes bacterium]|nr:3-isopropylmalate dehydratase small subunit [Gemmatimonadota bacterium]MYB54779.1 3-isopropylmalate dehydratase small subunit [Gemmatimonadota bacterium]MYC15548.1 3-isopropylmalate dehydratase small subunit [Gemmatimonadota bacterium]MYD61886.1 3-isopropylmalate dehydratase small subunit [Gemmatimonadota bacterium]MYF74929.1 3-isopropylmalate dehydratase small subunit [Gemmatimonadota bacterium]
MNSSVIQQVEGRAIPVRGNDIDTDRIIPARYLRAITFDGLGEHAFEDDRKSNPDHPFDDPRYQGASVLIANDNFGCGSSREHAPQALMRWGICAIVGESFAEIFLGNCTAMGVPCLTASTGDIVKIQDAAEADPQREMTVDLKEKKLTFGDIEVDLQIAEGNRLQLIEGAWDATGMLLEGRDAVREVANKLPYVTGF